MNDNYKPFSEREGYTKPKPILQKDLDTDMRTGLWNAFYKVYSEDYNTLWFNEFHETLWTDYLKEPIDNYHVERGKQKIKSIFVEGACHEILNLVEFCFFANLKGYYTINNHPHTKFLLRVNEILARENSAYKIVNGLATTITSEQEIKSIKQVMNIPYQTPKKHINNALILFSDRENPDYANTIKESISAVESLAEEITGEEKSLNRLLKKHLNLHPNFRSGLAQLYSWTSKDGGMRHGLTGGALPPDQDTARFMLVTCSAFVNYIVALNPPPSK